MRYFQSIRNATKWQCQYLRFCSTGDNERRNMGHWWNDTESEIVKCLEQNLSQWNVFHHKSHKGLNLDIHGGRMTT